MSKPRCDGCRFWQKSDQQDSEAKDDIQGECHSHPPVIDAANLLLQSQYEFENNQKTADCAGDKTYYIREFSMAWAFPVTRAADWCGEFQSKLPVRKRKK